MSVEGSDFVAISERIIALEESEIAWRVAAGRAYYGAFHCCSDLVDQHPAIAVDQTLRTQERVYQAIASITSSVAGWMDIKKLAYKAKNIRDIRTVADYKIKDRFRKEQALQAISAAKNVLELREQFRLAHKI